MFHRLHCTYLVRELRKSGLEGSHPPILMMIYSAEGLTQEDLAYNLKLDKSAVARAVASLIERGYVERRRSEKDKRCWQLYATEKTEKVIPLFDDIGKRFAETLADGMSDEETSTLVRLLSKTIKNLSEAMYSDVSEFEEEIGFPPPFPPQRYGHMQSRRSSRAKRSRK